MNRIDSIFYKTCPYKPIGGYGGGQRVKQQLWKVLDNLPDVKSGTLTGKVVLSNGKTLNISVVYK